MSAVYLDNAATTPLCDAAVRAINDNITLFGNPSSLHSPGQAAETVLENSRATVKRSLGVTNRHDELVFCASGSEANNLALIGAAHSKASFAGKKIITTRSEHPSVINCCKQLEKEGFEVVYVPCPAGKVDADAFENALDDSTFLVSVMTANNETGAVYDVNTLLSIVRKKCPRAYFHTDATQAYMKMGIKAPKFDMLTFSGHKINAPKGIGALYVAERVIKEKAISPVIFGGGQEKGLRSGTENVLFAAALAASVTDKITHMTEYEKNMNELREYAEKRLGEIRDVRINCPQAEYLPSLISLIVKDIKSEVMLHYLSSKGVFVSSGSACSSHHKKVSHVMTDFGLTEHEADCTLRVSMSGQNTKEDIDALVSALSEGISTLAHVGKRQF